MNTASSALSAYGNTPKRSLSSLEGVHPDLVKVVNRAIELTQIDFTVIDRLRTKERQAQLLKYGVKCKTNELGLLAYYSYKKTKLIDSQIFRSPQYEPVIPDSKGENILYAVCSALYGQGNS